MFFEKVIEYFNGSEKPMNFENILYFLEQNQHVININWFREESWKQNQNNMIQSIKDKGL